MTQRWAYRVERARESELEARLNDWGDAGWEVVHISDGLGGAAALKGALGMVPGAGELAGAVLDGIDVGLVRCILRRELPDGVAAERGRAS